MTPKKEKKVERLVLDVYNAAGDIVGKREMPDSIFQVPLKEGLVHLAVVAQQAGARKIIASTKTRGEVRGGGKKPWKQKGTGRARHGSTRSPLWRGGGVTFGPRTDRNYELKMNKKARQKALCMVLSQRAQTKNIILVDSYIPEKIKTKDALSFLKKLPLALDQKTQKKKRVIGFVVKSHESDLRKSLRNISFLKLLGTENLNIVDVLKARTLIMPLASLEVIEKIHMRGL